MLRESEKDKNGERLRHADRTGKGLGKTQHSFQEAPPESPYRTSVSGRQFPDVSFRTSFPARQFPHLGGFMR
jgi:hypothetical protein